MDRFNGWLGDKLAFWLSTMGCFYIIFALVIVPLFFQHPDNLVGWVNYVVQSIFQGVALPVLGYVARIAGERQEKIVKETHDAVIAELGVQKDELTKLNQINETLLQLVNELHQKELNGNGR